MMLNFIEICSLGKLRETNLFLLFHLSALISFPVYLLAAIFILRNKSKTVQVVKKQYLKQMAINFIFIIILSVIVCPVLEPPVPGYYVTGLLATFRMNVALPLVLMTHGVLLVALSIIQLIKHQLITLSDLRFTKKFERPVYILRKCYQLCYALMLITAISIIPSLSLEFELDGFRQGAYEFYKTPLAMCENMFIADHRHWKLYIPYFCSLIFGVVCSLTGVSSVVTCLLMIYESRKVVSRETLIMQRNFTGILIYQSTIYSVFIILPITMISSLFYMDLQIQHNGLPFLIMICSQGTINNLMHIIPGLWKLFCKRAKPPSRAGREIVILSSSAISPSPIF